MLDMAWLNAYKTLIPSLKRKAELDHKITPGRKPGVRPRRSCLKPGKEEVETDRTGSHDRHKRRDGTKTQHRLRPDQGLETAWQSASGAERSKLKFAYYYFGGFK